MRTTLAHRAARVVVAIATLRVPDRWRDRMVAEWRAELAAEAHEGRGWALVRAALGAFADAKAVRHLENQYETGHSLEAWMSGWLNDFGVALRGLRRAPGFSVVAVLTLAIGIGGTAALYSVLDRVVLDPLPYPDAERLVKLENQVPGVGPDERWAPSTAQQVHLSDNATLLEAVGLYRFQGGYLSMPDGPVRANGVLVTRSMIDLLGARARPGRVITEVDDQPGAIPVAMLSHGFWTRQLGADPQIVGRTVTFNDAPLEVIGVLEPGLELPGWPSSIQPDVWQPLRIDRGGTFYNSHVYPGIGRLAPGATEAELEAELERLNARLPERFPRAYSQGFFDRYGFRTDATPLKESVLGDMATNLWLLFAGAGLVLLVACANALNLFLVRMEVRRLEVGLRAALGASRPQIARYVFAEAMSVALIGGGLGLLVGFWAVPILSSLAPEELPRIQGAGMDVEAVGFALLVSLAVGLGLTVSAVVFHVGRGVAERLVGEGGRGSTVGRGGVRVRSVMVVSQVALALTLTISAALLVTTVRSLYRTDVGFEPEGAIALDIYVSPARYAQDADMWRFHRELLERVAALPEVASVGMGEELPISGGFGCTVQYFEDETVHQRLAEAGMTSCAGQTQVSPGYFEALRVPVLEGRAPAVDDSDDPSRGAVVVSSAFAERFWPGESALGKGVNPSGRADPPFYHVVGVVGDVPSASSEGQAPLSQPAMAIYYPMRDMPDAGNWGWSHTQAMSLVIRTRTADAERLVPAVRGIIRAMDPEVPIVDVRPLTHDVAEAMVAVSFVSLLLGIAAAMALLLSAIGLYGTLSYWVGSRRREIGMRLAIGARPRDVLRQVTGGSARLAGWGLLTGVLLAAATTRVLERLLVGVAPTDARAYATGMAILVVVSVVATWVPARRAAGVDPAVALRTE